MTSITITTDFQKKKLSFSPEKVALGERVNITFPGALEYFDQTIPSDLRLRVEFLNKTIAKFPLENSDTWGNDGQLSCVLNLNTDLAQMIKHFAECKFILDNVDGGILYGVGFKELMPWRKEEGEDIPYNLDEYPDIVEEFRQELDEWFTTKESEITGFKESLQEDFNEFKTEVENNYSSFQNEVNESINGKADTSSLESEVSARQNEDTLLDGKITTNASNITKNETAIENEERARENGDSELLTRLNNEISARQEGDGALQRGLGEVNTSIESVAESVRDNQTAITGLDTAIKANKTNIDTLTQEIQTKAPLVGGKVPAANLPSFVDDVIEVANYASLPTTGESGKIYVATNDNTTYRWGGSGYVKISNPLTTGQLNVLDSFTIDEGLTAVILNRREIVVNYLFVMQEMNVNWKAYFRNDIEAQGNISTSGNMECAGLTASNNILAQGNISTSGNMECAGLTAHQGDVNIGDGSLNVNGLVTAASMKARTYYVSGDEGEDQCLMTHYDISDGGFGGGDLVFVLHDRSINVFGVYSGGTISLEFPSAVSSKARDFVLNLTVADDVTTPTISLPEGISVCGDDLVVEAGKQYLIAFTEIAQNVFKISVEEITVTGATATTTEEA